MGQTVATPSHCRDLGASALTSPVFLRYDGKTVPQPKLSLSCDEVDAAHRVLKEMLRAGGPGAVRETEQALGLYRGYIRYHRHRRELDLGVLLAILKRLDVRPSDFFSEVAAELGADAGAGGEGDDSKVSPMRQVSDSEAAPATFEASSPSDPPDVGPLTARAVLRKLGADLTVFGDLPP